MYIRTNTHTEICANAYLSTRNNAIDLFLKPAGQ